MKKKLPAETILLNRLTVNSVLAGKDMTASDLAEKLAISPQYLSELLYGRRNPTKYAVRIAKTLGVPLNMIVLLPEPAEADQSSAA